MTCRKPESNEETRRIESLLRAAVSREWERRHGRRIMWWTAATSAAFVWLLVRVLTRDPSNPISLAGEWEHGRELPALASWLAGMACAVKLGSVSLECEPTYKLAVVEESVEVDGVPVVINLRGDHQEC